MVLRGPAWSPDGSRLALFVKDDIVVIDAGGGEIDLFPRASAFGWWYAGWRPAPGGADASG